jgi:phosphonate transport system substrate-binding protein
MQDMRDGNRSVRAWGAGAPVGTRDPVVTWKPAGSQRVSEGGVDRLRFGTYLAPGMLPVYEAVAAHVGRRLGMATELVVETSYESCEKDENEVCFVCSLPYVTFERQGLDLAVPVAAPVLEGSRYGGRPIYFSDVIVHRESPFRSFLDLRGRSWAFNEPRSHSGYGITRYHLVRLGETNGFFGQLVEAGFHDEAVRMVAHREVDGSAVDSQVLALVLRDDPELAERVRVVEALGPSTIQPVAVSRRVPHDLREAIRGVLVTMHEEPGLRGRLGAGLVERFVPVHPASYDDIRLMVDACEAAGFLTLR